MEKNVTSLDLHYLVNEFDILVNSKLDQAYQPKKKEILLQFHIRNTGKKILRILLPDFICLADFKEEQKEPMEYCKILRKYLSNTILKKISQIDFERILELHFQGKDENYILIIELFSKGNLILCKSDYTIISPLEIQRWANREVKPKIQYKFPEKKFNLLKLEEGDLTGLLQKTEKNRLVTFLAIDLSLGGEYSEKICFDVKTDKDINPKNLQKKDIEKLFAKIKELINKKENINEKIEKNIERLTIKKSKYENQLNEVQRIVGQQKETITKLEKEIEENNKTAELIYHNYKSINEILTEINKAAEKHSWQEIKERLKGHKTIKEVNAKDKTVVIEI